MKNKVQVALDMLHAATCLATLRKVEDSSTSCNLQRNILLHCKLRKWGVTRATVFATCNATFVALQVAGKKIASCNMALTQNLVIASCFAGGKEMYKKL